MCPPLLDRPKSLWKTRIIYLILWNFVLNRKSHFLSSVSFDLRVEIAVLHYGSLGFKCIKRCWKYCQSFLWIQFMIDQQLSLIVKIVLKIYIINIEDTVQFFLDCANLTNLAKTDGRPHLKYWLNLPRVSIWEQMLIFMKPNACYCQSKKNLLI